MIRGRLQLVHTFVVLVLASSAACGSSDTCGVCPSAANGEAVCTDEGCGIACHDGFSYIDGACLVDQVVTLSAGDQYTCGVTSGGTIACWGQNFIGQTSVVGTVPEGAFTSISAGTNHACGVGPDGAVTCWGNNVANQTAAPMETFLSVSAGFEFSCGVKKDPTSTWRMIDHWGQNQRVGLAGRYRLDTGDSAIGAGLYAEAGAGINFTNWAKQPDTRQGDVMFGLGFETLVGEHKRMGMDVGFRFLISEGFTADTPRELATIFTLGMLVGK